MITDIHGYTNEETEVTSDRIGYLVNGCATALYEHLKKEPRPDTLLWKECLAVVALSVATLIQLYEAREDRFTMDEVVRLFLVGRYEEVKSTWITP